MTATLINPYLLNPYRREVWAPRPSAARPGRDLGFAPAADVYRDGGNLVARFDLPGIDPENDVTVELEGRKLVVHGERKDARTQEDRNGVREVRLGTFRRVVTLPRTAPAENVSARYDSGVLEVTVGDVLADTEPQRITVQAGSQNADAA